MSKGPSVDGKMIVLELLPESESELLQLLNSASITGIRTVCNDSDSLLSSIANDQYDVLLLSNSVSIEQQKLIAHECLVNGYTTNTIVISTISQDDKDQLLGLMEAGVNGVELMPSNTTRLNRAMFRAAYQHSQQKSRDPNDSEQIVNLSWLLEGVASRLEKLGERLGEENEGSGFEFEASPKNVKEALLSAIGTNETDNEKFSDDFVYWLKKKLALKKRL
jgi:DNA-binding NarL/FixJ family response regulator